ncbi:hypothetical protein SARC_06785 [Sphaeroforma arctica JP610]|uniref:Dehydrogenase E1 component domain-containing protein n=1 Tax=Sphaeroforma arctica JP610 TaxID=667725 RepID=A0A0L0FW43_9EUKA|nr:hypothetical protein SARC_06785 [Sphaeroforma arctica JP610]KNC80869.1 hypothetical protein SARC_06785 [Sphaeroforma arctica JP610]|eukprot:XP_014154771.1 hypothetical protein SARC_06785 [Sphaeroforma arctica JP610]
MIRLQPSLPSRALNGLRLNGSSNLSRRSIRWKASAATESNAADAGVAEGSVARGKYVWKLVWSEEELPPPSRDEWYGRSAGSSLATTGVANYDTEKELINLPYLREQKAKDIQQIPEFQQSNLFKTHLTNGTCQLPSVDKGQTFESVGFYTIGPGGEELMSAVGQVLRPTDAMALHYRHLAASVARQRQHLGKSLDDILIDRARGHVVSSKDPVSHGRHCLIGGSKHDFLVTSTLASQAPPAVGRALGGVFANQLKASAVCRYSRFMHTILWGLVDTPFPKDFISYVSVGDGSVNNAHFLSATNLAEYTQHRGYKAPVVFGISDNGVCISLKGYEWLQEEFQHKLRMPVYVADGNNMLDMWDTMARVTAYTRETRRPATVIFSGLVRRFGHAATDRQSAYLTQEHIQKQAAHNALAGLCAQAVGSGVTSYPELLDLYDHVGARARAAFDQVVNEPKITTRDEISEQTSAPRIAVPGEGATAVHVHLGPHEGKKKGQVMRKHMTKVIDETLEKHRNCVYLGEDVAHGGYYLVTDGLAKKHPMRYCVCHPLPTPSDVSLCVCHPLPTPSDRRHILGVDVDESFAEKVLFSSVSAVTAGRVVMSVDSTNLLNTRHVLGRDDLWQTPYTDTEEVLGWDEITCYGQGKRLAIVTYGGCVSARPCYAVIEDSPYCTISLPAIPRGFNP